jgi:hypothetical protein
MQIEDELLSLQNVLLSCFAMRLGLWLRSIDSLGMKISLFASPVLVNVMDGDGSV